MPGLLQIQVNNFRRPSQQVNPTPTSLHPEDTPLWFPSAVSASLHRAVCTEGLPDMEDRLRTAQCHDALHGIRNTLRLKTHMVFFKNKNSRGQREGLRSRSLIDRVQDRVKMLAEKYRAARKAKLQLVGTGP